MAGRGSRNVALLEPAPTVAECPGHVYVVNRRPLTYLGVELPVGTEVPDASSWRRLEAWVNARAIRLAAPGEEFTPYADFVASLEAVDEPEETAPVEE